jgi:signal transduction histidine kinase
MKRKGTTRTKPLQSTSRSAQAPAGRWRRLQEDLRQRTAQLAVARRVIAEGASRRCALESGLKKQTALSAEALHKSRQAQRSLEQLTHRMLATQEADRTALSRNLHDQIGQTLLGLQVGLAALRNEAGRSSSGFAGGIRGIEELLAKSTKTLERFAGRFGNR